jgi:nitroimidazol reductase NimA-like FMN-containing flavoprotein (pyridoxamine 5'-phosphate oxidase superfamily)
MRKTNQEIRDRQVLQEILQGAVICRIAMMDGDRPYILPVNYGYSNGCLYIHSAPEGKKIDLLRKNRQVCFEVEEQPEIIKKERACDWTTLYRSVVGYGEVDILTDEAGRRRGLEVIMAQHGSPDLIDFNQKNLDRMVILKLRITSMTGKRSGTY